MLHRITKSLTLVFFLLSQFLSIGFAYAQDAASLPITPDGTTSTFVTQTASGIDQVNIAAPNSSGLSHNKFENYFYLNYILRILFYGEFWNTFDCKSCDRSTIRKKFYLWFFLIKNQKKSI